MLMSREDVARLPCPKPPSSLGHSAAAQKEIYMYGFQALWVPFIATLEKKLQPTLGPLNRNSIYLVKNN